MSDLPWSGWTPDSIPFGPAEPDGSRYALLQGRRDAPDEAFAYAFTVPAGAWNPPHRHTAEARIFVACGCLKLGFGAYDPVKAQAYPAGSFIIVPANQVHFDGADEDTLVFGTAIGPWSTIPEPA